jgi:hypothetical protein
MAELPLPDAAAPEPGSYDFNDPTDKLKKEAETSLREDRLREVEAAILSTPGGREWLWGVLISLHTFEQRISMTGSDYENGLWSGEREGGLRLLRRFASVSPADFAKMFQEQDRG